LVDASGRRRSIKEADPPARQRPLPGVRRACHVGIPMYDGMRRRLAPGGGGPAAGGAIMLASRTRAPCSPCACPRGARPAVHAELRGQARTMAPAGSPYGRRASGMDHPAS
jgi:hypothetical protein